MPDADRFRRQLHDDDEMDVFTSATASGLDLGYSTGGGASSSTAIGTSSPRARPYPQRNGRGNNIEPVGQGIGPSGRNTRMKRRADEVDDDSMSSLRYPKRRDEYGDAMDVDESRMPPQDRDFLDGARVGENDVQRLLRAWQNERHAPDILPTSDELLGRVLDKIREQTKIANTLRSADVTLSEEEHYCTTLVQTEVERVKFVVRSYVRSRLSKIEQYAAHITMNPDIHPRLTKAELHHAQRYAELVASQFNTTVLAHLPEPQQSLDDGPTPAVPSMITTPDKSKPVFFHAFDAIEGLLLDDGTTASVPKDAIMLVPYRVVEQHVLRGEVELV